MSSAQPAPSPELVQTVYTTVMKYFIENGLGPHYTELSAMLDISVEEARLALIEAAGHFGCWMSPHTDYIGSFGPFYSMATQYPITVDGEQKWFAQCGFEMWAVRWLFPGKEVRVDTRDLGTGEPMHVTFKDEEILDISHPNMVAHFNKPMWQWGNPEYKIISCNNCERMNIFVSKETCMQWSQTDPSMTDAFLTVEQISAMFSMPLFRRRMDPDFLSKMQEYRAAGLPTLIEHGMTGELFLPPQIREALAKQNQ